jgi:hypothetical protein
MVVLEGEQIKGGGKVDDVLAYEAITNRDVESLFNGILCGYTLLFERSHEYIGRVVNNSEDRHCDEHFH